ncbi:FecR domain-containing protein [Arenibacter certesii]|uniref:Protein FecR C-terminal domain-containing protein n=1 Tax=Arenibacter certesii TaxID=228955 RepID=A0A918IT07_9FLAO|nr:DUF4974 domain-containing protein [Arenibacter certesii]GGW29052.1 hypothetical protein GCM10007383_13070 [Arenibacter certesii]
MLIEEVNIAEHINWINGKILLRHVPFKKIVKKLERHYNVKIINNNKKWGQELITASFDIETIDQVFQVFNETYKMDYNIKEGQIIIN